MEHFVPVLFVSVFTVDHHLTVFERFKSQTAVQRRGTRVFIGDFQTKPRCTVVCRAHGGELLVGGELAMSLGSRMQDAGTDIGNVHFIGSRLDAVHELHRRFTTALDVMRSIYICVIVGTS